MISPTAIREFLNRKLDDHTWMKELSESKLDSALCSLSPKPNIPDFMVQQKVGLLLGLQHNSFFYIYDMGSGKSLLDLKLTEYRYQTQELGGISVVLVPTDAAVLNWEEQIQQWKINLPYRLLLGSTDEKWQAFSSLDHGIVVSTYIGYSYMVSELREVTNRKTGKKKNKLVPVPELLNLFSEKVNSLTLDESTSIANTNSLAYETVHHLSFKARYRYGLAGRPFGRDPQMIWPQMFLLDHGASLSRYVGVFREAFFSKKKRYWGGPFSFDYTLRKDREADLAKAIGHRSLSYSIDECVDLPDLVPVIEKVNFPEDLHEYYRKVTSALVAAKGNIKEQEYAFMRMRQICSGFLGYTDDETGEKAQIEFKDNPKLDVLIDKIEQMPRGRKMLVWHEFTWTGARISKELTKRGIKHGWLWGGTKNQWPSMKDKLDYDPDYAVQILQWKIASMSLNLQSANYEAIIESPVSPIYREQLERRAHRTGQTRTVFRYDIVVRRSVEEKILKFHKDGADLFASLIADPERTLAE